MLLFVTWREASTAVVLLWPAARAGSLVPRRRDAPVIVALGVMESLIILSVTAAGRGVVMAGINAVEAERSRYRIRPRRSSRKYTQRTTL